MLLGARVRVKSVILKISFQRDFKIWGKRFLREEKRGVRE
jgi:hypothetical protein